MIKDADRGNLQGWDRNAYLLKYYDTACWYAVGKWGTSHSVDTLTYIAVDELLGLVERFPTLCESQGRTPGGALFWSWLRQNIEWRVLHQWKTDTQNPSLQALEGDDEREPDGDLVRTQLSRYRAPSMLHHDVADFIAVLPLMWKTVLALRFYEEMSNTDIEKLMGIADAADRMTDVARHVLSYALHETVDEPNQIRTLHPRPWTPPEPLQKWLQDKYGCDIHSYIGLVQLHYFADVSYVVDILDRAHGSGPRPGARGPRQDLHAACGGESAYRRHKRNGETIDEACADAHALKLDLDRARKRLAA